MFYVYYEFLQDRNVAVNLIFSYEKMTQEGKSNFSWKYWKLHQTGLNYVEFLATDPKSKTGQPKNFGSDFISLQGL